MRDGSGNYALPTGNPVVTGTNIDSTWANTTATDIADALSSSISKDGQTTPTQNLPMGGNRHTGASEGTMRDQYATVSQLQDNKTLTVGSVANVTNAYTGAVTPAISSYADGMIVLFTPNATNTDVATLALNGLAIKSLLKENNVALVAGDLVSGVKYELIYNSAVGFVVQGAQMITGTRVVGIPASSLPATVARTDSSNTFTFGQTFLPTTGVAFAATGPANTYTAVFSASQTTGQSLGPLIHAGTNASDIAMRVQNALGSADYWILRGDGVSFWNGASNFAGQVTITSTADLNIGTTSNNGAQSLIVNTSGGAAALPRLGVNCSGVESVSLTYNGTVAGFLGLSPGWAGIAVQSTHPFGIAVNGKTWFAVKNGSVEMDDGTNTSVTKKMGYRGLPQNLQNASYTCVLADAGKHIGYFSNSTPTYTIPANAAVPYDIGDTLTFVNGTGAGNMTIHCNDTMVWAATNTTGDRTIAPGGMATALKVAATLWYFSGSQVS